MIQPARKHFDELLSDLREQVMEMGSRAERMVGDAVKALLKKDLTLAREVVDSDGILDRMELEIHSTAIVIIAREAPVAKDVRLIAAVMGISSELERVGDDAVSIAKKALTVPDEIPHDAAKELTELSEKARGMLLKALKSFREDDPALSEEVIAEDAEVDALWKRARRSVKDKIRNNPDFVDAGLKIIQALHHLEYVGDRAVSIVERLEFVRTGNLVRFCRASF